MNPRSAGPNSATVAPQHPDGRLCEASARVLRARARLHVREPDCSARSRCMSRSSSRAEGPSIGFPITAIRRRPERLVTQVGRSARERCLVVQSIVGVRSWAVCVRQRPRHAPRSAVVPQTAATARHRKPLARLCQHRAAVTPEPGGPQLGSVARPRAFSAHVLGFLKVVKEPTDTWFQRRTP